MEYYVLLVPLFNEIEERQALVWEIAELQCHKVTKTLFWRQIAELRCRKVRKPCFGGK
jgi:hypothetical protein